MRIKETKVYQFDELSDAAKETARSWYREASAGDDFYAECAINDAEDALKVLGYSGVKIMFSGFSSQGDGACFTAQFYASDYDGKGTNAVQAMLVDRSTDKELARCAAELESILLACPELSASISHHGRGVDEMSTLFSIDCGDAALEDELLTESRALAVQYAAADAFDAKHAKHANDGRTPRCVVYRLVIDNGAGYASELPDDYATEEEAQESGENWLTEFRLQNDLPDDDDSGGFDVIQVPVFDPEEPQDDEPELSASISHQGRYVHEMSTRFSVCCGDDESLDTDAIEERFKEVSRDLMRWIYKRLEADYEWNNADEQVDENIRINEYEFDGEGNRA